MTNVSNNDSLQAAKKKITMAVMVTLMANM